MDLINIYVDEEDSERLDLFLAKELNEVSRTFIQGLIKDGLVLVNGKNKKSKYIVIEGDFITINLPKPREIEIIAENLPLHILYEDEDLLVVNKEQGMVVHPAPGNYSGTLVNALLYHTKELSSINGVNRPGIVHRLDKDTSGLLVIAKNDESHIFLAEQFKNRNVKREYIAIVHGQLKTKEGTINAPIGRDPKDRKRMTVIMTNSKEAITHYEVLEEFEKYSLVKAKLETGRTHQIRVHFDYINHSVLGDPLYSKKKNDFNINQQVLHARKIGIIHPRTKEYMEFETEIPFNFQKLLKVLK